MSKSSNGSIIASNSDANRSSKPTTRILATGFNAHGQLSPDTKSDLLNFVPICETGASDLQVLFAGWSETIIVSWGGSLCLGFGQIDTETYLTRLTETGEDLVSSSGVGDLNGLSLTLTSSGKVYDTKGHLTRLAETGEHLGDHNGPSLPQNEDAPLIGHIALAQNGRVALTYLQTPTAQLCHVLEFASYERFKSWYEDPSGDGNYPDGHHMLPGRPKQLLANTGTFMLLMEGGEVFTWGDARYESLGRSIAEEDGVPADKPGIVEALGGIRIKKIAACGWMCAALSEDGALYLWGTTSPGGKARIKPLKAEDGGDVALVEIPGGESGEPLDVLDVAVGDDHIAVVAEGNRLFVVGNNLNGQLGTGVETGLADWQQVIQPGGVRAVWCGPLSTFVLVDVE